jgi:hypothetical protein
MSTLFVDELYNGVTFTQTIRLENSISVAFIRPWIYKQGTLVDGQLRLQVYDGATLLKQVDIDYSDINTELTQPYAHGYIRFDTEPLILGVTEDATFHDYILKFSMINHTTDNNNYIGICRDWDVSKYPIFGTAPFSDAQSPAGYELYGYRSNEWRR